MNSTRAPGGTPRWVCQLTEVSGLSVLVQRHAVQSDEAQWLGDAIKQNLQIEVRDGRGIQHAPQLTFPRLHRITAGG